MANRYNFIDYVIVTCRERQDITMACTDAIGEYLTVHKLVCSVTQMIKRQLRNKLVSPPLIKLMGIK